MSKGIQSEKKSAYAQAGVNIDVKMNAVGSIKEMVAATKTQAVIGNIGAFGGLHKVPTGKDEILVASADGVGPKLKVAAMMNKHDTVGQDIVNHCVNELLGGETAEMPGLYPAGEYDLVGTIVGHVKKSQLITGKSIRAGDMIIGFPSGGLQTNGFSLARRVIFDLCQYSWQDKLPGTNQTFGDALLAVHKSFLKPVAKLLERKVRITGMAHITGGGFPDNIPRVLPKAVNAEIDRASWEVPTIFKFIQNQGKVDRDEMYRVFNMGIGFVVIIPKNQMEKATNILKAQHQPYHVIGVIRKGTGVVTYKN